MKPCPAQPLIWTSSILGLQLGVDKCSICCLPNQYWCQSGICGQSPHCSNLGFVDGKKMESLLLSCVTHTHTRTHTHIHTHICTHQKVANVPEVIFYPKMSTVCLLKIWQVLSRHWSARHSAGGIHSSYISFTCACMSSRSRELCHICTSVNLLILLHWDGAQKMIMGFTYEYTYQAMKHA